MGFHDSRRSAPQQKYGTAGTQYPTPNISDVLIIEDVPMEREAYVPALPGTPHPQKPTALLVWRGLVIGNNNEVALRLIYCTSHGAQEVYNGRLSYSEENHLFPIYSRTYFLPRDGYAPLTEGTALTSLIGLSGTGGTGYLNNGSGQVALVFTGGSGSGASGLAEIVAGVPVAFWLTLGGTGWTAGVGLPVVTVSGAHATAATITPVIQSAAAVLTHQTDEPEPGEFSSLFLRVERAWETLPGPEIPKSHHDTQTGTDRVTYRQRVTVGTAANPVSALKIASVSVANPTVITLDTPHGRTNGTTFPVRIAGVTGGTAVDGDRTATFTGVSTLTVPVNVGSGPTANTGFVSFLKNSQVIIDSYVEPDAAGSVAGTLITVAATLPGREFAAPDYDQKRAASVNEYRQFVTVGTGSRAGASTYKGQTVEDSTCEQQSSALSLLRTSTILLPGDPIIVYFVDEETGASKQMIRTRVIAESLPDTIGAARTTGPNRKFTQSKLIEENAVVSIKTSVTSTDPSSRTEIVDGSEAMPSLFTYLGPWTLGPDGFNLHGPFLGVNYDYLQHGISAPGSVEVSYTWGKDPSTVTLSGIFAPISGRSGIGLPINGQTLHDGYTFTETIAGPSSQTVEIMPESIPPPADYVTGDSYVAHYTDRPHEGGPLGLWERRVTSYIAT